ncbi:hypothetical protein ACFQ88_20915 [Paenibacillus sp. NPDC056579]
MEHQPPHEQVTSTPEPAGGYAKASRTKTDPAGRGNARLYTHTILCG